MAKRTKTQKKRAAHDLATKARVLFLEGLLSAGDVDAVQRIANKAMKKL